MNRLLIKLLRLNFRQNDVRKNDTRKNKRGQKTKKIERDLTPEE